MLPQLAFVAVLAGLLLLVAGLVRRLPDRTGMQAEDVPPGDCCLRCGCRGSGEAPSAAVGPAASSWRNSRAAP